MRVELPSRATLNESYQLLEAMAPAEAAREHVVVDCSRTTRLGPFGVALIEATLSMRRLAGRTTELRLPEEPRVRKFVEEVGLSRFASGERVHEGTLEVRAKSPPLRGTAVVVEFNPEAGLFDPTEHLQIF